MARSIPAPTRRDLRLQRWLRDLTRGRWIRWSLGLDTTVVARQRLCSGRRHSSLLLLLSSETYLGPIFIASTWAMPQSQSSNLVLGGALKLAWLEPLGQEQDFQAFMGTALGCCQALASFGLARQPFKHAS